MRYAANPLRVLIVDDEVPARRKLLRFLQTRPEFVVAGEAADGISALRAVQDLTPDVVFLDIQMPGLNGLEVAANLPVPRPHLIFVTAFDAHAIKAFELNAIDYLLKPWDAERLELALCRLLARRAPAPKLMVNPFGPLLRLLVQDRGSIKVVPTAGIVWLMAEDNYVHLHTDNGKWMLREPLTALLERLQCPNLLQVHRSHAINLERITEVIPLFKGDGEVLMHDGARVPFSRNHRAQLLARLSG